MIFFERLEFWIMVVIICSILLIEKTISIIRKYFRVRREANKKWIQNMDMHMNAKRRARLKICEINNLTRKQIKSMLKNSKICSICYKPFNSKRKKTLDHIIALSKGGNNTSMNIQIICSSCNLIKGVKNYTKFNGGQKLLFVWLGIDINFKACEITKKRLEEIWR